MKVRLQLEGEAINPNKTREYGGICRGMKTVWQYEGMRGFYKGLMTAWTLESVYSFIGLGLYEPIKRMMGASDPSSTPWILKMAAAGVSGCVGASCVIPMDIVKIRTQAQENNPRSAG